MNTVENIIKRMEYGKPFMKKLSNISIKDIVAVIEKVWENSNSNFYATIPNEIEELLQKEYSNKRTTVEYNSNLDIEKVTVSWNYWDSVTIELSVFGMSATYKPEHGANKTIFDVSWVLIDKFFEDCYQK